MDEAAVTQYITDTFDDVHIVTVEENSFFSRHGSYDPVRHTYGQRH